MARPSLSKRMARTAISALVAAVEIYNKPTVEYREQTFAVLLVNAWEVLLKARIVQINNNKMSPILERKPKSRVFKTDEVTEGQSTIPLKTVLGTADIPGEVRDNLTEVINVRNEAVHMGLLHPELKGEILKFGTASVQNFVQLAQKWFAEPVPVTHLLPVGFVGDAQVVKASINARQNELLRRLSRVSAGAREGNEGFAVSLSVDIRLNPQMTGGGVIAPTHDANAPKANLTTDQLLEVYPNSHEEIKEMCKKTYSDFKVNRKFNDLMREFVKKDPNCAFVRPNNPKGKGSGLTYYYNGTEVLRILDGHYERVVEATPE